MSQSRVNHRQSGFEASLTWEQANDLRIIVNEHVERLFADKLVAEHRGLPNGARGDRYQRALTLEAKVNALFRAVSAGRE